MDDLNSDQNGLKELSRRLLQACNDSDDSSQASELLDQLFTAAKKSVKLVQTNIDETALQKVADKLVVTSILDQLYFVDTSAPQIAYLHHLAKLNDQFESALKFVLDEINSMNIENRSELDENIQKYIQVILG